MNYLKSNSKEKIKIPVIEAEIKVITEDYKNLNKYMYYLLNLLYEGKTIEYIAEIIKFNKWQIENELESLSKYGLVHNEDDRFRISPLGKEVINRSREINSFNERKERILIDKLTGSILRFNGNYEVVKDRVYRVVKDTYKNINPTNSKEFFLENYCDEFKNIKVEDIDIELNLKEEYWIEFEIVNHKTALEVIEASGIIFGNEKDIGTLDEGKYNDLVDKLIVKTKLYKINYKFENTDLNIYRHSIDSLKQIQLLDEELLSAKAKNLINLYEEEKLLNSNCKTLFIDSVSGMFNDTGKYSSHRIRRNSMTIEMKEFIAFKDISENQIKSIIIFLNEQLKGFIGDGRYKINYSLEEELIVNKEISHEVIYKGAGLC